MKTCLFCTESCSPISNVGGGDPSDGDEEHQQREETNLLEFEEDSIALQEQLRAFLIISKILKIPKAKFCQLLQQNGGNFQPETWLGVCSSCGESVSQFYKTLQQVSKLERKLAAIEAELLVKIHNSNEQRLPCGNAVQEQIRNVVITTVNSNESTFHFKPS